MACVVSVGSPGRLAAQAETGSPHAKPGAASAPPPDPYTAAEKTSQGDLGHPYVLPPASRARMHECGVEWQAMKMSGAATDKIWRIFATACLTTSASKTPSVSETSKDR